MPVSSSSRTTALVGALALAFTFVAVDYADARRGGSFGSRGTRTFQSAPPTQTAPRPAAPVERSMTPQTAPQAARQPGAAQPRPGMFGSGLGGSLMRGLVIGGLIGMLMGYGFGGMAGLLGFAIQALLLVGLIMLAMRFFRSRQTPAPAAAYARSSGSGSPPPRPNTGGFTFPGMAQGARAAPPAQPQTRDIALDQADLDTFERRLGEVQDAFGREDHGALRRLATPEMVSYLSEELADNAKRGLRNAVSDVRLLQADIAESWRESDADYATAALRYEARDVLEDRETGRPADPEADAVSETTELWTFRRARGEDWKLSAIQES